MAISREAKAAYDRARYAKRKAAGLVVDTRDRAAKAAYDRERYAARYEDQRRAVCAREGCSAPVQQPKRGRRLYCSPACRSGAFYGVQAPPTEPMPKPYTGHRWLDMAREAAGGDKQLEFGLELYDRYTDEMGEAVLALLEGGDPKAAVIEFRRREYVARYRTTHFSEWASEEEEWKLDRVLAERAPVESAEDVAVGNDTVRRRLPRIHWGNTKGMMGTPRQASPTNRRQNAA